MVVLIRLLVFAVTALLFLANGGGAAERLFGLRGSEGALRIALNLVALMVGVLTVWAIRRHINANRHDD